MALILKAATFSILSGIALADGKCNEKESTLWLDSYDFTQNLKVCAVKSAGGASKTSACLVRDYNGDLSAECASCFGQTVDCGRVNCIGVCAAESADPKCLACVEEKGCNAALATCTGFATGPPNPTLAPAGQSVHGSTSSSAGALTTATAIVASLMLSIC